jgi:hypothetical protein
MTTPIISLDEVRLTNAPTPTAKTPYAMLEWLFEQRLARVPSDSGKDNYRFALTYYKRYVQATVGEAPFDTRTHWGILALVQFKSWLEAFRLPNGKALSAHTAVGIMSSVRQVMLDAVAIGFTAAPNIANAALGDAHPETDAHAPYDTDELAAILEAVKKESQYVLSVLRGYQFTGCGRDPRLFPKGFNFRTATQQGLGWAVLDNVRWYFENEMKGVAITTKHPDAVAHKHFMQDDEAALRRSQ